MPTKFPANVSMDCGYCTVNTRTSAMAAIDIKQKQTPHSMDTARLVLDAFIGMRINQTERSRKSTEKCEIHVTAGILPAVEGWRLAARILGHKWLCTIAEKLIAF